MLLAEVLGVEEAFWIVVAVDVLVLVLVPVLVLVQVVGTSDGWEPIGAETGLKEGGKH